jgi:formylglycine-generating enzyme required for sulfatase activity
LRKTRIAGLIVSAFVFLSMTGCNNGGNSVAGAHPGPPSAPDTRSLALPFPLWDGKQPIKEYSRLIGVPPSLALDLGGGVQIECVLVPAGIYLMGTPAGTAYHFPWETQHWVIISKPFYMSKHEITLHQYNKACRINTQNLHPEQILSPICVANWDRANEFCANVSKFCGVSTRLPTEAEWEFACRAGTTTAYYSGQSEDNLLRVGWYTANRKRTLHEGGEMPANAFGLFDMHGNVWEWCQDWFDTGYYEISPLLDPQGPGKGMEHVYRGGALSVNAWRCDAGYRPPYIVNPERDLIGIRLVVELPKMAEKPLAPEPAQ